MGDNTQMVYGDHFLFVTRAERRVGVRGATVGLGARSYGMDPAGRIRR
jgi:hypothetical protein